MTILKPKDVADRLGKTTRTLQKNSLSSNKKQVAYARVSTYGQKDDLKDQLSYIRQYANAQGIVLDEEI